MNAIPKKLHLGCGRWHLTDHINIDIDPRLNPDIVYNLNYALPENDSQIFETKRFGAIQLPKSYFERLVANDLLEHIRELTTFMKSCRDLLVIGGVFDIQVPYDLSHGAWQDPTHVRAFNERSWTYFTDWYWMFGWEDFRFNLEKIDYVLSDFGKELHQAGKGEEEILRTPRATDAMHLQLKKVAISQEEKEAIREYLKRPPGII